MRFKTISVLAALLALPLLSLSRAQAVELVMSPESRMWIDGTSNKSDWTVNATEMSGTLVLDEAGAPARVTVAVAADKIESDNAIMDRLMHRALKTTAHPTITYALTSISGAPAGDSLATDGQVTVAGVTREAPLKVQWVAEDGGAMRVRGNHAIKMTDHGMKPPTAMFGALHTGDKVVVQFDVVFAPASTASDS